jgi:hypothetical protein
MFKTKLFTTISLASLLAATLFSAQAFAAENTGMVVASRGDVTALSEGVQRPLQQGESISVSDQIVTGDKSFATLQFIDGAKVTVRPNSTLIVEEYVYNGGDLDAATLSLVSGGLRVITGAMAKSNPENYKVKTPVALMGVRGTEFSVMLCDGQLCESDEVAAN